MAIKRAMKKDADYEKHPTDRTLIMVSLLSFFLFISIVVIVFSFYVDTSITGRVVSLEMRETTPLGLDLVVLLIIIVTIVLIVLRVNRTEI
jgi:hypothetical protein